MSTDWYSYGQDRAAVLTVGIPSKDGILDEPRPTVMVDDVSTYGIRYKVNVYHDMEMISVDEAKTQVVAALMDRIYGAGLQIALPKEEQIAMQSRSSAA